jgi:AcrR family transcriptional regulator
VPRPDMRAERIPQILEAAMAVFGRSGFAQARMDDIAREAGLSKAALYLYFPSKDDIIAAILETYFAHGLDELSAIGAAGPPLADSLVSWVRRRMHELRDNPGYLSIGFEFHALAARDPRTRDIVQRAFAQYHAVLAAVLGESMRRGELAAGDPDALAIAIMSLSEGLTMVWMLDAQRFDPAVIAEHALHQLLKSEQ